MVVELDTSAMDHQTMTYNNRHATCIVAESRCQGTRQQSEWSLDLIFDLLQGLQGKRLVGQVMVEQLGTWKLSWWSEISSEEPTWD